MKVDLDTSFFSVVCELGNALYTPEIDLTDMRVGQLIEDIRTGQYENVRAVLECNPVEGWCNDITEDVLTAAFPETSDGESHIQEEDWSDYRRDRIDAWRAGVVSRAAA
ncbi:hypothetical protein [Roseibium sp. MMSF_3544]|uniref:hypothetical protein n=1 Tax=unclassified Roseibium TaxID=2629323 RepID=UPI00273ED36C|nr:hypothetical protein [Roseibium sp. MMSF_3544]